TSGPAPPARWEWPGGPLSGWYVEPGERRYWRAPWRRRRMGPGRPGRRVATARPVTVTRPPRPAAPGCQPSAEARVQPRPGRSAHADRLHVLVLGVLRLGQHLRQDPFPGHLLGCVEPAHLGQEALPARVVPGQGQLQLVDLLL